MIVIINGPLGVGKTETSWQLLEKFDRAVMLDGDYIGAVHPFDLQDETRVAYLYQTLVLLVGYHRKNGYTDFVINYVFETADSLALLRQQLTALDQQTYAFRLVCSLPVLIDRISKRNTHGDLLAWELQRGPELAGIQEKAARHGDLGYPVDTTNCDSAQAAGTIWDMIHEAVVLEDDYLAWKAQFVLEIESLRRALGDLALDIQHVGSTAVPGLIAKPVIDIMIEVEHLDDAQSCIVPLQKLGYTFVDHPENTDRRFFRKGQPRTHHIHIVERGTPAVADHLDFRDALCSNKVLRQDYAQLKRDLAQRYRTDRHQYTEAKTAFISAALAAWRARQQP
jgi:GrpB-like predicted nucleotidyltransferase (UPF0157 family)